MNRWNPETLDPILKHLHRQGHFDGAITTLMLDMGHSVSKDDVGRARRRLGLRANTPCGPALHILPAPKEKPNPLAQAKLWLDKRLVEKREGGKVEYRLDGRPTNLTNVMQTFNRMRVAMGIEQILTNPACKVPE